MRDIHIPFCLFSLFFFFFLSYISLNLFIVVFKNIFFFYHSKCKDFYIDKSFLLSLPVFIFKILSAVFEEKRNQKNPLHQLYEPEHLELGTFFFVSIFFFLFLSSTKVSSISSRLLLLAKELFSRMFRAERGGQPDEKVPLK